MRIRTTLIFIAFCLVLFYALFSIIRIGTSLAPDFSVFYDASRGLIAGKNIYALPMYTGLGYPPFSLLPYIPLTIFPYQTAQWIWIIASFLFLFLSIYLSLSLFKKNARLIDFITVFILSFLSFPVKFTLGMGQVNFLALVLLLLAMRYKSGFLLGLLCIIKPHFLLFLPLFGVRTILIAAVTLAAGALLTGLAFGWNQYLSYIHSLSQLLVFSGREIYYNQGLGAFLSRLLHNGLAGDLTLWISLLLIAVYAWVVYQNKISGFRAILLCIPVFLLVEPLSWQHHYVFLLPVYVWLATKIKKPVTWTLFVISYILVSINFRNPPGWIMSHVFFGNILLLSLVVHENTKHTIFT